jgi:hypothetical protein
LSWAALHANVSHHDHRATASTRGERFAHLLQRSSGASTDGDTHTSVREWLRDAATNAAAGGRYECGLTFKPQVHRLNSAVVISVI